MKESQKVHNNSSEIESLRTSLNAVYIDVIKNAESAQIKFPLKAKARENVCSRDNLLSYYGSTGIFDTKKPYFSQ